MKNLFYVLILTFVTFTSFAATDLYEFTNSVDKKRYEHFNEVLRCPKCQNQNLAGSDSVIASDLRRVVYEQINEGRSDKEIADYMVARYGEYILYSPPLTAATVTLWFGPIVLFLVGIIIFYTHVRQRKTSNMGVESLQPLSNTETLELDAMLNPVQNQECSK